MLHNPETACIKYNNQEIIKHHTLREDRPPSKEKMWSNPTHMAPTGKGTNCFRVFH